MIFNVTLKLAPEFTYDGADQCCPFGTGATVSILIVLEIDAVFDTISTTDHPYVYVPSATHVYDLVYNHLSADIFDKFELYNSVISDWDNARLYTRTSSICPEKTHHHWRFQT